MSEVLDRETSPPASEESSATGAGPVIVVNRRRLDIGLMMFGALLILVLLVAGALLTWGSNFAENYVHDELAAQNITFPEADALIEQGRDDLAGYGGEQVTTGKQAEAYSSYIGGHVEGIADGATYAELGGPERAASAAAAEAIANGAPAGEVAALEEEAAALTEQRESIFRGEMLRGALLNTYAWSTIGRIAGIAAIAAFIGAATLLVLVVAGVIHLRRTRMSHFSS
ncbi:MAG: hypothetical protein OEW42_12545 [Acidimicrobiia bacterium]|nr:hypothetical protein [Acidimicrobiia bacterium]